MGLRRDLLIGLGILVALNLLLALGSIGLLTRMSPALKDILDENVVSIEAAEIMLSCLVEVKEQQEVPQEVLERFSNAFLRAKNNVTETAENPILDEIENRADEALRGNPESVSKLVTQILTLTKVNRQAMLDADNEAQRLGTAGAWASVLLAVVFLVITIFVVARLNQSLVKPYDEFSNVLEAACSGDRLRRCRIAGFPPGVRKLLENLNDLLDRLSACEKKGKPKAMEADSLLRQVALVHLLENYGRAAVLANPEGKILAANQEAVITLSGSEGSSFRSSIEQLAQEKNIPDSVEAVRLKDLGWLAIRKRVHQ